MKPNNLSVTGHKLTNLSSTNGSGGVVDIFYPQFKLDIGTNKRLFKATTELWEHACLSDGTSEEMAYDNGEGYKYHSFGAFDCKCGFMYIDRIGYRIPSKLAHEIAMDTMDPKDGAVLDGKLKKKKIKPIQRSLTPHLDCCPKDVNSTQGKDKWRPIQCFVSLTNNLDPNTGGFEAAPGFHLDFNDWMEQHSNGFDICPEMQAIGKEIKCDNASSLHW